MLVPLSARVKKRKRHVLIAHFNFQHILINDQDLTSGYVSTWIYIQMQTFMHTYLRCVKGIPSHPSRAIQSEILISSGGSSDGAPDPASLHAVMVMGRKYTGTLPNNVRQFAILLHLIVCARLAWLHITIIAYHSSSNVRTHRQCHRASSKEFDWGGKSMGTPSHQGGDRWARLQSEI